MFSGIINQEEKNLILIQERLIKRENILTRSVNGNSYFKQNCIEG